MKMDGNRDGHLFKRSVQRLMKFSILVLHQVYVAGLSFFGHRVRHNQYAGDYLSPQESFQFNIDCNGIGENECKDAKTNAVNVGKLIAGDIVFWQPIFVNIEFNNATDDAELCHSTIQDPIGPFIV